MSTNHFSLFSVNCSLKTSRVLLLTSSVESVSSFLLLFLSPILNLYQGYSVTSLSHFNLQQKQKKYYITDMKLQQEHIDRIKKYFVNKPVLRAYLFGSYSRGDADEDSDIDILVELDYSKQIGLEFVQMQLDLQDLLQHKVDLLSAKAISKYIYPFIENDKYLIYEK